MPLSPSLPQPALALVHTGPATLAEAVEALCAAEREVLAGFNFVKRRQDWLLGRLAAKRAVCAALGGLKPHEVSIAAEPSGHPIFTVAGETLPGWDLSLTHGHGHAAAIVAPTPVGIDLEKLRDVPANGWRFFLTEAEREWLSGLPLGPQGEIVAWALKEAAYKAVAGATRSMHHLTMDLVAGGRALIGHEGGPLVGRYVLGAEFCLAVAVPAAAGQAAWWEALDLPAM